MKTPEFNPKISAYIAGAQPFAQPILTHLRELVHQACPGIVEEMKWSRPFFVLDGVILANIAAFQQHCSLGIWGPEMQEVLAAAGIQFEGSMGTFGRLTSLRDLPPDKTLLGYFRQAAAFITSGQRTKSYKRPHRVVKVDAGMPPELAAALKKNEAAAKVFAAFPTSCQREYCSWIAEAKRPETRERRIAQAVEWIAEGKQRNWRYQSC